MSPTPLTLPWAQAPLPVASGSLFSQEPNRPEATSSAGFANMLNERMQARSGAGTREAGSPDESGRPTQSDESPRESQASPGPSGRASSRPGDAERSGPLRRLSSERPAGDRGSRVASSRPDSTGAAHPAATGPAEEGLATSTGARTGLRPGEGELSCAGDPALAPTAQAESLVPAGPASALALALAHGLETVPVTPGSAPAEASTAADGLPSGVGARPSAGHAFLSSGATATSQRGGSRPGAAAASTFPEVAVSDPALQSTGSGWDPQPAAADPAEAGIQSLLGLPAAIGPASPAVVPGLSAGLEGLQAMLPAEAASGGSAPAPSLQLATPVTAPDFSRALAAQLTTWASGGVQEATLQLNPADMGPIAVSIMLDGALAQIDFAAAHAQTRQVIEAGLPSLAAALHGAGLTLAGGGVFEQRPGSQERGPQGDTARQGADQLTTAEGGRPHEAVVRRQTVLGLVDTYA